MFGVKETLIVDLRERRQGGAKRLGLGQSVLHRGARLYAGPAVGGGGQRRASAVPTRCHRSVVKPRGQMALARALPRPWAESPPPALSGRSRGGRGFRPGADFPRAGLYLARALAGDFMVEGEAVAAVAADVEAAALLAVILSADSRSRSPVADIDIINVVMADATAVLGVGFAEEGAVAALPSRVMPRKARRISKPWTARSGKRRFRPRTARR